MIPIVTIFYGFVKKEAMPGANKAEKLLLRRQHTAVTIKGRISKGRGQIPA
jgi:hypothetical protein